jgi:Ca2+:H+ antiporter
MKWINYLLIVICIPTTIIGTYLHAPASLVFFASAVAIIPLAGWLGVATEEMALRLGPRIGGLLNATMGNAAELIIAFFALRAGLIELVKASITGSIIGNLLLVMGFSLLIGGMRHGVQKFHREQAGTDATLMILGISALVIPAIFNYATGAGGLSSNVGQPTINPPTANNAGFKSLNIEVSVVLVVLYFLSLIYSFGKKDVVHGAHTGLQPRWSRLKASLVLLITTAFIAWMSEILVHVVEPVSQSIGISHFFIGIILVPIVGNVAEHLVAVQAAANNQMDLSMSISMGSSLQVALFVGPILVFFGLGLGQAMDLVFNRFELAALATGGIIAGLISLDGRSNWFEGAMLLGVYLILAGAFYYLP